MLTVPQRLAPGLMAPGRPRAVNMDGFRPGFVALRHMLPVCGPPANIQGTAGRRAADQGRVQRTVGLGVCTGTP